MDGKIIEEIGKSQKGLPPFVKYGLLPFMAIDLLNEVSGPIHEYYVNNPAAVIDNVSLDNYEDYPLDTSFLYDKYKKRIDISDPRYRW